MPPCGIELTKTDPESPGIVLDEEAICRGAYGPPESTHFTKGRNLRVKQLVRKRDVVNGTISVWRSGEKAYISEADLLKKLNEVAPTNEETYLLFGLNVKETREREISDHDGRVFCIIDDCVCDADGNKHPAHASITLCKTIKAKNLEKDDPLFDAIKETLVYMLSNNIIWKHKDAPTV